MSLNGHFFPVTGPFWFHRSPVDTPHDDQWRRALMFSFIYGWTNDWANNRDIGDLRRQRAHEDITLTSNVTIVPLQWRHNGTLSVLVFIPYEYWSSLSRLILFIYMYTGDGAVGVTTMSLLVGPRVVLVTACGATGRYGVFTLTAPLWFSVYTVGILIVLISINSTHIHIHWGWGCQCDDYVGACGAAALR